MNTSELQHFLHHTNTNQRCKMFVCAIDKLCEIKMDQKFDYGFVVNLSHSSEPGSHWTGLYIKRIKNVKSNDKSVALKASYFDSYGFVPKSFYLRDFIKNNCKKFQYNEHQFQQLSSKVCGMYASCFILHMSSGGTLKSFIDKFSKKLRLNDELIQKNYAYMLRNSEVRKFLALKKQELKRKNKFYIEHVNKIPKKI